MRLPPAVSQNQGRYLLLRIVSKLSKVVGIGFVGQDPGGNAIRVELFASPWALVAPGPELDATIPLGSTLIVREPFLQAAKQGPVVRPPPPAGTQSPPSHYPGQARQQPRDALRGRRHRRCVGLCSRPARSRTIVPTGLNLPPNRVSRWGIERRRRTGRPRRP